MRDRRAGHRPVHQPGQRISADGLEGFAENQTRPRTRFSWRAALAVAGLFAVVAFAAASCQQSQVRFSKEQAIASARPKAGFAPQRTQIRLVRQGITGHPFWAVSFSVAAPSGNGYSKLTTVRIDANTGTVEAVTRQR
jgi:hypothetical protein